MTGMSCATGGLGATGATDTTGASGSTARREKAEQWAVRVQADQLAQQDVQVPRELRGPAERAMSLAAREHQDKVVPPVRLEQLAGREPKEDLVQ
jgi:hypothetical protein